MLAFTSTGGLATPLPARSVRIVSVGHKEACEKYGIEPDRDEGLLQYCTRHNGFEVGSANGNYEGVCTNLNERAFLDGWGSSAGKRAG